MASGSNTSYTPATPDRESACWTTTAGGATVFTGTIRHDDGLTGAVTPGWALFDQNATFVPGNTPGLTFVTCVPEAADQIDVESLHLCDAGLLDAAGEYTQFVRTFTYINGVLDTTVNTTMAGAAYNVVGPVYQCGEHRDNIDIEETVWCLAGAPAIRRTIFIDDPGVIDTIEWFSTDGVILNPSAADITAAIPGACPGAAADVAFDVEEFLLCDENGAFRRRSVFNPDGTLLSQNDFTLDGTAYTVGTLEPCATAAGDDSELSEIIVCADAVTAIRRIETTNGVITAETFIGPDGAVIVPTEWQAGRCITAGENTDSELVELCDVDAQGVSTSFMRRYTFDETGAYSGQNDYNFAGAPYAVTGTVGLCETEQIDRESVCWTTTAGGTQIFTGTIRHDDSLQGAATPSWALFNQNATFVPGNTPGLTFVPCSGNQVDIEETVWCVNNAPTIRRLTRDITAGTETITWFTVAGVATTPTAAQITAATPGICVVDTVVQYETTVVDVTGGVQGNFAHNNNMISWTIRNRNATSATVRVTNDGAFLPLDSAESMGASLTGHDVNDVLIDDLVVRPGDGTVRVTITRRV